MIRVYLAGILGILGVVASDLWFEVNYRLAANIALVCIASFVTVFMVLYWWRSRWRSNYLGKAFLIKGALLAAVLWQAVVAVWIDTEYPYRHLVRFVIYTAGAVAYLVMLLVLRDEQRRDRDRERDREVTPRDPPP